MTVDLPSVDQHVEVDMEQSPSLPDEMTSRDDLVHPNMVFDLDPNDTYDKYPDIKAYLALVGTTAGHATWVHSDATTNSDLSPRERERVVKTRKAVRRGVEVLIERRERRQGVFVEASESAPDPQYDEDDEDEYIPDDESALPWLRATGFAEMEYEDATAYLDQAVLSARAQSYKPADDSDDDDGDDDLENELNDSLLCGNVRIPLPSLLWRKDLEPITPATPEWVMLIRSLYSNFAHPLAILHGLIRETDDPVCTPKLLADRDASRSWLWVPSLATYQHEAANLVYTGN